MVALRELFTTDIGLLSLGVIAFIILMAVWFGRFFMSHIRQEEAERAAQAASSRASAAPPAR